MAGWCVRRIVSYSSWLRRLRSNLQGTGITIPPFEDVGEHAGLRGGVVRQGWRSTKCSASGDAFSALAKPPAPVRWHRAMLTPPASHPWSLRVLFRVAARQNRRRDRLAPTRLHRSTRPALLARPSSPAVPPGRRAIDPH